MTITVDFDKYSRITEETFFKRKGRVENVGGEAGRSVQDLSGEGGI